MKATPAAPRTTLPWRSVAAGLARTTTGVLLTLLLASFVIFAATYAAGDPLVVLLAGREPAPDAIAALTKQYGLDQPLPIQYLSWLSGVLSGDLGFSLQYRTSVSVVLPARIATTALLVACGGIVAIVIGLALGAVAATNRGAAVDGVALVTFSLLVGIPPFVSSAVLVSIFAVQLNWLPSFGMGDGGWDTLWHLILPATALAGTFIALVGRISALP